jgi:hypothetical protein
MWAPSIASQLPQKRGCSHTRPSPFRRDVGGSILFDGGFGGEGTRRGDQGNGRPVWCVTKVGYDKCRSPFSPLFLVDPGTDLKARDDRYRRRRRTTPGWVEPNASVRRDGGGPMRASRTQRRVEPNNGDSKSTAASWTRGRWSLSLPLSPTKRRLGLQQQCVGPNDNT